MYTPRNYRYWITDTDLVSLDVVVGETDLYIRSCQDLKDEALEAVVRYRSLIEAYIRHHPTFLTTLKPFRVDVDASPIVKEMIDAAAQVGLGPMAAVAGAMAEKVGSDLLPLSEEVIVENGGDIFLKLTRSRSVVIYAGSSPLSGKIGLKIAPEETPLGICTSSGTVGHSLSFGKADAVVAVAPSTLLADAAATAIANRVCSIEDIAAGTEFAQTIEGLRGTMIIKDDRLGVWGNLTIVPVDHSDS